MARPEPDPLAPSWSAIEGLEDPLQIRARDAGPAVRDPEQDVRAGGAAADGHGLVAREVSGSSRARSRAPARAAPHRLAARAGRDRGRDRTCLAARQSRRPRRPTSSSSDAQSRARLRPAGLDPCEVEQIADEALEPRRLLGDHGCELAALLVGDRLGLESAGGGGDRGQRRAQVVRHRAEQRGLHDVRAAERLRLDDLRLELVAAPRRREQRLERRDDPVLERDRAPTDPCPRAPAPFRRRLPPTTSGIARRRSSAPTQLGSTATERRPKVCAMRCPTVWSDRSRLSPLSSSRAISAVRSASARSRSACDARVARHAASVLVTAAATRNTASATQFSPFAIVNCPSGGCERS